MIDDEYTNEEMNRESLERCMKESFRALGRKAYTIRLEPKYKGARKG